MAQLVRAPARKAGYPSSNPGPGENFSLKLLIGLYDLPDGYSDFMISIIISGSYHQIIHSYVWDIV